MPYVMLRPDAPHNEFRRSVFGPPIGTPPKRSVLKTLTFRAGDPVELDGADLLAVRDDFGKALVACVVKDGVILAKPDYEAEFPLPSSRAPVADVPSAPPAGYTQPADELPRSTELAAGARRRPRPASP